LSLASGSHILGDRPVLKVTETVPEVSGPDLVSVKSWRLCVLGALLAALYVGILARLVGQWWADPNFSHGFIVPIFSAFVLWQRRERLAALPLRPSWAGIPILAAALALLVIGTLGAEQFVSRISLLFVIAGLVLLFLGWSHMRAALFPWAFLVLMIPLPSLVFNQITLPLQLLASKLAASLLQTASVPVLREGNVLQLPAMSLEVAEACSGIRSLLSLITLALIYGYWMERRLWVRAALVLAAVPIAVLANGFRIVGTGLCVHYWNPERAQGFFHIFSGWIVFLVSLGLLFLVHHAMRWLPGERSSTGQAP
jgi:exosortase